jgi:hypothetical protein
MEVVGLTSVQETPEFRQAYDVACSTYKGEGGIGNLDLRAFKVIQVSEIHANFRTKSKIFFTNPR